MMMKVMLVSMTMMTVLEVAGETMTRQEDVTDAAETLNAFVKATCVKLFPSFILPISRLRQSHFIRDCRGDTQWWLLIEFALMETADAHSSHGLRLSLSGRDPNRPALRSTWCARRKGAANYHLSVRLVFVMKQQVQKD
jgi:hypothetical protein